MFIQSKVLIADELAVLEDLVNTFLAAIANPLHVVDVQYNLSKTSRFGHNSNFSAVIIYWKEL